MTTRSTFRPEIQGLRAIAVLSVLAFHLWPRSLPGGFVGVDAFFVISGFLITKLLVRDIEANRFSVVTFYQRRVKRLVPAATATLIAVAASYRLLPTVSWPGLSKEILASTFYVQNWFLGQKAVDYFTSEHAASPLQHFWSLAVEEQFYIFWPWLLFLASRLVPSSLNRRRGIGVAVVALFVVSLGWSVWRTHFDPEMAYFSTLTRAWELALGGALAIFVGWERWESTWGRRGLRIAGLVMLCISFFVIRQETPFPSYTALLPTLGTVLIIVARGDIVRSPSYWLLSNRVSQYFGDISYSLYLWHWPVIILYRQLSGRAPSLTDGAVIFVVSVALAHQSKTMIEDVFRKDARFSRRVWSPFVFAGVTMLVTSLCALGVGWSYRSALAKGDLSHEGVAVTETKTAAEFQAKILRAREDKPEIQKMGCYVYQKSPEPKRCDLGDQSSGRHVVLVGDSHANQWVPALRVIADQLHWKLSVYGKSACAFADVSVVKGKGVLYESCNGWRENVFDLLKKDKPALVIIGQSRGHKPHGVEDKSKHADILAKALAKSVKRLNELGIDALLLGDTPRVGINGPECLSNPQYKPGDCDRKSKSPLARADPVLMTKKYLPEIPIINLNDRICPGPVCPAIIDGEIVWRDSHHITASFAKRLAPELKKRLLASLPSLGHN